MWLEGPLYNTVCQRQQQPIRPSVGSRLSVNLPKLTDIQFIWAREKHDLEVTLTAAEPEARYICICGREGGNLEHSPRRLNWDPVSMTQLSSQQ